MIPESELAAIRARAENATPGPWERDHGIIWGDAGRNKLVYSGALTRDVETLEFIAAARADVPRLLDEVEDLRGLARELAERCAAYTPNAGCRELAKGRQAGLLEPEA